MADDDDQGAGDKRTSWRTANLFQPGAHSMGDRMPVCRLPEERLGGGGVADSERPRVFHVLISLSFIPYCSAPSRPACSRCLSSGTQQTKRLPFVFPCSGAATWVCSAGHTLLFKCICTRFWIQVVYDCACIRGNTGGGKKQHNPEVCPDYSSQI